MSPIIRTLIFTVFVPGFWTVLMPYWMLPHGVWPDVRGACAAGWLLIAEGIALYFACAFWGFAVRGKGTPLPLDPPKKLFIEEPALKQKFGAEYEEYCRQVPRWIPRVPIRLSRRGAR